MPNKGDNSGTTTPPGRFNWEEQRRKLDATAPPLEGEGVHWDKPAPTESPIDRRMQIPKHLHRIVGFFKGIIGDEGLLMDLCLDHVMDMVKRNVEQRTFGTDAFQGEQITPVQYAALSGPLTVELYKEVTKAVAARADEYAKLHQEARLELERASQGPSRIVLPP